MNDESQASLLRIASWALWLLAGVSAAYLAGRALAWRTPATEPLPPADPAPARASLAEGPAWTNLFGVPRTAGAAISGGRSDRLRLAGTFFVQQGDGLQPAVRSAILDDLSTDTQHWVREGDDVEGMEVVRIYRDRVIVRIDGADAEIRLSFADSGGAPDRSPGSGDEADALETTRFGKRIGENRWVMQKSELAEFYRELLDDPERIAGIYMAMQAVRGGEENEVIGFRVQPGGDEPFFAAVGLRPGDEIRKVNSMNMTSQARAEYFLSEFMKDRLGAVVLDVVREDQEQKLIYLMR